MSEDKTPLSNQVILEQPTKTQSELILPGNSPIPVSGGLGRRKLLKRVSLGMIAGLTTTLPLASTSLAESPTPSSGSSLPPGGTNPPQRSGEVTGHSIKPNVATSANAQDYAGYDFKPIGSGTTYNAIYPGGIYWTGTGDFAFWHRLQLPDAAKITRIEFWYTDNASSGSRLSAGLYTFRAYNASGNNEFILTAPSAASGVRELVQTGTAAAPIATIDNGNVNYQLFFQAGAGNSTQVFWGAYVYYTNVTGKFQAA